MVDSVLNFKSAALAFDSESKPVAAAWAYEVALVGRAVDLEILLNLVSIYVSACDPGFSNAFGLDRKFVDLALVRAQALLRIADAERGPHGELAYWRTWIREMILGEQVQDSDYREIVALPEGEVGYLPLFLRSGDANDATMAREFVGGLGEPRTERVRFFKGFNV